MRVVVAFTSDVEVHSGGAKQLYRHVDVLNSIGIDAVVAHPTRDFRLTWFKNDTKVCCSDDLKLGADDFLMFGEQVGEYPAIIGHNRCAKVVYVQNPYGMFMGFNKHLARLKEVYGSAAGVLCQSDYTEENVRHFFPAARAFRVKYSFDREPWGYCGDKHKVVAYMPRKNSGATEAVFSLMAMRRCPDDWQVMRIEGCDEDKVAQSLKVSAIFASFSMNEGFGMPAAEAMACGCAVVGFPGFGGAEYMSPGLCWPVRDYDVLSMVTEMERAMMTPVQELAETGRKASEFVREEYSTEKEVAGIKAAWDRIARPRVELETPVAERVRKEVAAYVPVYNEGPYLEALLRWLVKRVGAVFVCESEKAWCPTAEPGGKSKAVVDKVLAEMPEAAGVLWYLLVTEEGSKETEPLKREAEQRNRTLDEIRKAGFPHVWMVEADEFYADAEADRLWEWYFRRDARVVRCSWHTYWRSLRWRVDPPELFRPTIVFRADCRFESGRKMAEKDEADAAEVPAEVCVVRHYSWARTPKDTARKLSAWGHALQLRKGWMEDVFLPWRPGADLKDFHPTALDKYKRVVRCELPLPEALEGHPFASVELIGDESVSDKGLVVLGVPGASRRPRIKAVVMSHNQPESVDALFGALSGVFDDVEVFDSGSDPDKVPCGTTRAFPNIYWTGLWNEVVWSCRDYDAVWVMGGDVELTGPAEDYRKAIESSLPFGIWSPTVAGRAKPFMRPQMFEGQPRKVWNVEGIAMAVSGELLRRLGELPKSNGLGYGQDLWMCWRSREEKMENVIDGRVQVFHPPGTGYDGEEAGRQMDETFEKMFGKNYRKAVFRFSDFFEENVRDWPKGVEMKKFTVVTVDNGWGVPDFLRIVSKVGNVRALVMRKGVMQSMGMNGVETVPYDPSLEKLLQEADAALFAKVGEANREEYLALLKAGVPMVAHDAYVRGTIEHQKNGYMFVDDSWAMRWLSLLRDDPAECEKLEKLWGRKRGGECGVQGKAEPEPEPAPAKPPRVSVITPTYRREPKIVMRCVGSLQMQTMKDWEQVVCSDGGVEPNIGDMVKSLGEPRTRYSSTTEKKEGDFGNTVRSTVLRLDAKGEFVLFLDDDNIVLPQFLEKMVAALDAAPDAGFAVCRVMHFGPLHESEGKAPKVLEGSPVALYHVDPLQVLVRREAMMKVGWDVEVGYLSDGVTLEKLGKEFKHVRVEEVLGVHL